MRSTKRNPKVPKALPTFVLKASWDATAIKLKLQARNAEEAIEKAWMRVSKLEGGMSCLSVRLVKQIS